MNLEHLPEWGQGIVAAREDKKQEAITDFLFGFKSWHHVTWSRSKSTLVTSKSAEVTSHRGSPVQFQNGLTQWLPVFKSSHCHTNGKWNLVPSLNQYNSGSRDSKRFDCQNGIEINSSCDYKEHLPWSGEMSERLSSKYPQRKYRPQKYKGIFIFEIYGLDRKSVV